LNIEQGKMKGSILNIVPMAAAILLTLASGTRALPQWMKPRHDAEGNNAPREYKVYDPPSHKYGGYYTYAGYGPRPTIPSPSPSSSTATSEASGEETSSSDVLSGILFPRIAEV
jgi:hypothetical protein